MKSLLIAVVLLLPGAAPAADAGAGVGDRRAACEEQWRGLPPGDARRAVGYRSFLDRCLADCPARVKSEDGKAYGLRARDYCEARWTGLLPARQTGGQTHDEFVDSCLRRCVTRKGATSGAPLGWILGGIGAAALAGGVNSGTGSHPPPASP
jgi:hypothetical protein